MLSGIRASTRMMATTTNQVTITKRVLVPVANGSEDIETTCIIDTLRRGKILVDVASIGSSSSSSSSSSSPRTVTLARGCVLTADMTIEEAAANAAAMSSVSQNGEKSTNYYYDCIALPGGMPGAENLRDSKTLLRLLQHQVDGGARSSTVWYAAMCASPCVVLASHGLLEGVEEATCHPSFVNKMKDTLLSSSSSSTVVNEIDRVVVSKNCITSRGPGTSIEFALQIIASLLSKEEALAVAQPMLLAVPPVLK